MYQVNTTNCYYDRQHVILEVDKGNERTRYLRGAIYDLEYIGTEIIIANSLKLVSIILFPEFKCKVIDYLNNEEIDEMILKSRNIIMFNYTPNLSVKKYHDFMRSNEEGLVFEIGKETTKELKVSRISTITTDQETLKLWKSSIRKLKRTLIKGAWVINNGNGSKKFYKAHYYTSKAKKLNEKGVRAAPFAGWTEYILNSELDV